MAGMSGVVGAESLAQGLLTMGQQELWGSTRLLVGLCEECLTVA